MGLCRHDRGRAAVRRIYDVIKKLVIHGLRRNEELDMLNTYHDNFGDPADDAPAQPAAPQPTENQ